MKVKIKTFNSELPSYLTLGKVYEVYLSEGCEHLHVYDLVDDEGDTININIEGSAFLNGGSWEVVE